MELYFGNIQCTGDMKTMSTGEMQIAEMAKKRHGELLTNLHNYIDSDLLETSFDALNKNSAPGVDNETWQTMHVNRQERLPALLNSFKSGRYRAPNIRRTYIPKDDGKQRPLGLPTIEDKVLQTAVNRILTPIYEEEFYDFSYGFRPGKSQHQAIEKLFREVSFTGKHYVIDADMRDYFGSIQHGQLKDFLRQRIRDKVTERMIGKWLKAGVMEDGYVEYPKEGAPQGGSISPLLSNIYLHHVLDEWFTEQAMPLLQGKSSMVRFADDFVMLFENKEDAERVLRTLPKRLGKYGLSLHPDKTRLVELTGSEGNNKTETFDFLGFTHYLGKSRKGKPVLKRKTSRKKLKKSLKSVKVWIRRNRHLPVRDLIHNLNLKLRGHYNYYGITFNFKSVQEYQYQVKMLLFKWLNRRGGKRSFNWEKFGKLVTEWIPLLKPRIYHSLLAKP